uniref:E3 ubiquitin-protein ligase ZNRF1-like isoform X1 n=1 Tax=Myxine glutinosa TaxID=7769 RepID=UPI00358E8DFF
MGARLTAEGRARLAGTGEQGAGTAEPSEAPPRSSLGIPGLSPITLTPNSDDALTSTVGSDGSAASSSQPHPQHHHFHHHDREQQQQGSSRIRMLVPHASGGVRIWEPGHLRAATLGSGSEPDMVAGAGTALRPLLAAPLAIPGRLGRLAGPGPRGEDDAAGRGRRGLQGRVSRVYTGLSQSLPAHLSPRLTGGFKCPICSKPFTADDMETHIAMCLSKPRITYNDDVLRKDSGECSICLEELKQGEAIARLPCLCVYHKRCIDSWFEINRSCPEHPAD